MGLHQMPRPIPELSTDLVTLRPPQPDLDARDYWQMNLEPDMHTWTGNTVLQSELEARRELESYLAMDTVSTWMIVDNPSNRVVGRFFLTLEERDGSRLVGEGNRIAKPFWRKGHNRAARALMFRYSFEALEADVIQTEVWAGNIPSVKSIEAHGFNFFDEREEWNAKHERVMGKKYYRLTRGQWLELSSRIKPNNASRSS